MPVHVGGAKGGNHITADIVLFAFNREGFAKSPLCQDSCQCAKKAKQLEAVSPCCINDEGRPLDIADQTEVSNHPELHPLRAVVVSVTGKGGK